MKLRGFELVSSETDVTLLPKRGTRHAAGYDFKASQDMHISPGSIALVPTGVKAYMGDAEVLYLFDRSSNPRKRGLVLINSVGVIDSDYYNNVGNEGLIMVQFKNISDKVVRIKRGDVICQGVFMPFLIADNDVTGSERKGGFGSTDE